MKTFEIRLALAASLLALSPGMALAQTAGMTHAADAASLAADRAAILGMAGTFNVTFDMRETTVWRPGYTPIPAKVSGGHESVRVIEDSGRRIVLQHLLIVETITTTW